MNAFKNLSRAWRIGTGIAVTIAVLFALIFIRDLFVGTKDVEAKLGTNQAGAAMKSGADAVNTAGDQAAGENARTQNVKDIQDDVDSATDDTGAHAAGADGLCDEFGICGED